MKVIKRGRGSGKTTILLHHMVVNDWAVLVCRTEDKKRHLFARCKELGLNLSGDRFFSVAKMDEIPDRSKILIDDADYICECHPNLGYAAIGKAHVITVTG